MQKQRLYAEQATGMNRNLTYIMRTFLVLLLFQFVSPPFFSSEGQADLANDARAFAPVHNSIVIPVFLKEKDEKEHEGTLIKDYEPTPPIDFVYQALSHTASQSRIYKAYCRQDRFGWQPPLFKLHRTFLI